MRLGIDGSNIRAGGGVTHLAEILRAAAPEQHGFDEVIVWVGESTLERLEERPWLRAVHEPMLDRCLPFRLYWQQPILARSARAAHCDLLFVPGGTYSGSFRPFVTMSRNLLPFEWTEARRYGLSWMLLKLRLLRRSQSRTLRRADGVIFLTDYAREATMESLKHIAGSAAVIPHGVSSGFECPPRDQQRIDRYSIENPLHVLYVSTVTVYKHQWHVAEGIAKLRKRGLPVHLDLVGPAYRPALRRLEKTLERLDPDGQFMHYHGPISYAELHEQYQRADAFVFASTCETFGQIVTEAMASGLPIACSDSGPMHELMGEDALYFDAERPGQIADTIGKMIADPALRSRMAEGAYKRARAFSWQRCADETFDFLAQVARDSMV